MKRKQHGRVQNKCVKGRQTSPYANELRREKPPFRKDYRSIGHSEDMVHDIWWYHPGKGVKVQSDPKNKGHVDIDDLIRIDGQGEQHYAEMSGRICHTSKTISVAGSSHSETRYRSVLQWFHEQYPDYLVYGENRFSQDFLHLIKFNEE